MSAQRASRWAAVLEGQRAPSRARRTVPLAAASAAAIGPRTPVLPCTTCVPPRSLSGGERACWGPPQHAHKSLEKKEQGLGPPKIYWRFDRNPCRSLKTLGNRRTRLYFDVVPRYSKKVVVPDTKPLWSASEESDSDSSRRNRRRRKPHTGAQKRAERGPQEREDAQNRRIERQNSYGSWRFTPARTVAVI